MPIRACNYKLLHTYRNITDQVIDFTNGGIPKHLGQIADSVYEWKGVIAVELGLTPAEVAAIEAKHPADLKLQK